MNETKSAAVLGTQQSPINIVSGDTLYAPALVGSLSIGYADQCACGKFEGDNFLISNSAELILTFRGVPYNLIKIHFHVRCEHLVDSNSPAQYELHLVHQVAGPPACTDKLVVGVFFDPIVNGRERKSFKRWGAANAEGAKTADEEIPLSDFVPEDISRWVTYQGSLTTYPFTEDVTWVVNLSREGVAKTFIDDLANHHANQGSRCIQLLYRRFLLRNYA